MKIKLIVALNKIANGEMPNGTEIRAKKGLNYQWFKFYKHQELFISEQISKIIAMGIGLNDEIEIIEEEKEIEKLNLDTDELLKNVVITAQDYVIEGKINELIDVINDMRDKE